MKVGRRDTAEPSPDAESGCTVHESMHKLVHLLPRIARGLRRPAAEPVRPDGVALGSSHGSALALVREHETTVGALATSLDLTLATVSGLMTDLEKVGFVERVADPTDRRRTIVRTSPAQQTFVDTWLAGASAPIVRVLQQLSPAERAVFIKAMGLLDAELNG